MSIVVTQKTKFGETLTVGELLDSLNSDIFKSDDATISLHTEDYSGVVVALLLCGGEECKDLHILANNYNAEKEIAYSKDEITLELLELAEEVLVFEPQVTKKVMIDALKKLNRKKEVSVRTVNDEGYFTLTGVYKCSETCPAIHLDTAYGEQEILMDKTMMN